MTKTLTFVLVATMVCALALTGCGKSRHQREQDAAAQAAAQKAAEQQRIAAEQQRASALEAAEEQRKEAEFVEKYRAKVLAVLKDPGSAQFEGLHLNERKSAVCGRVNSKNSYGGYAGAQPFVSDDEGVFIWSSLCASDAPPSNMAASCLGYLVQMRVQFPQNCS